MQQEPSVPPGTLAGVTYTRASGMFARVDFFITLSPQAILETSYFPAIDSEAREDEDWYHPSAKENVSITAAQWADVEQIILELYPLMKPIPEHRRRVELPSWVEVKDGGNATSLILTWNTEEGTRSIRYCMPNDRRVHTLIALLEELADPIGRKIPRYGPPELTGFYFDQSGAFLSKDYSFQFNRGPSTAYGDDASYIFRARFAPPGWNQVIQRDWTVPDDLWDDFVAFSRETGLEERPDGRSNKRPCTLYYSDGKQIGKKLNKKTKALLQKYLTNLAMQLMNEQS